MKTYYYNGHSRTIEEWAKVIGLDPLTLESRIHRGWDLKRALETKPLRPHYPRRKKV